MQSEGTDWRRLIVAGHVVRFWSDDGSQLVINDFGDPGGSLLYGFTTERTIRIRLLVRTIFNWPQDALHQKVAARSRETSSCR